MNKILYGAYKLLSSGLFMSCLPAFLVYTRISGRYGKNLEERLGYVPRELAGELSGSPRIWLHAVSLGEVRVAAALINALGQVLPECSILVSTTTEHGREFAKRTLGEGVPVVYGPVDFIGSVRKALTRVRPDIMVFLETEIWPAWLVEAQRMGIKTALINGRISVRSIGGYLRFRPLFREILKHVDAFSMISEEDADRIRVLGAPAEKVQVNGNAKYDFLTTLTDPSIKTEMQKILNLEASHQVFVAGSTREGEEEMILDAYKKILKEFPGMILIMAPRHIERTPAIESLLAKRGVGYQLWRDLDGGGARRTEPVVIINTFGELFRIYSVGTIVFCGASLVPLGGQNPLEAAAWGKVVFYGMAMDDFQDARVLLEESGSGVQVSNPDMLAEKACWFLDRPDLLKTRGGRAREAVLRNHNAAEKHARVIRGLVLPKY